MRHFYLSDTQWEAIKPHLPPDRGRKPRVDGAGISSPSAWKPARFLKIAKNLHLHEKKGLIFMAFLHYKARSLFRFSSASRSSRGLGHRPFTAATRVRIPYGTPIFLPTKS